MEYKLKKPCENCPFRSDKRFHLAENRIKEITNGLLDEDVPFACHKTTTEIGKSCSDKGAQHCAGALIFLEQMNKSHRMMRVAAYIGEYDASKLDKSIPIYKSVKEMIKGCA